MDFRQNPAIEQAIERVFERVSGRVESGEIGLGLESIKQLLSDFSQKPWAFF